MIHGIMGRIRDADSGDPSSSRRHRAGISMRRLHAFARSRDAFRLLPQRPVTP